METNSNTPNPSAPAPGSEAALRELAIANGHIKPDATPSSQPATQAPEVSAGLTNTERAVLLADAEYFAQLHGWTPEQKAAFLAEAGMGDAQAGTEAPSIFPVVEHFPGAEPNAYEWPHGALVGKDGQFTRKAQAFDKMMRNGLAAMGLTREIGNAILKAGVEVAGKYRQMSDAERELYARSERALLEQLWGAAALRKIQLVRVGLNDLKSKGYGRFVAVLERVGALSSAFIVGQLAEHFARISDTLDSAEAAKARRSH